MCSIKKSIELAAKSASKTASKAASKSASKSKSEKKSSSKTSHDAPSVSPSDPSQTYIYAQNQVLPRAKCEVWASWPEPPGGAPVLNAICVKIIENIYKSGQGDFQDIFGYPVPEDTPGYFAVIPEPMDLGTMKTKAEARGYNNISEFRRDLVLTIENCMTFNVEGSDFYDAAVELAGFCHGEWAISFLFLSYLRAIFLT